MLDYALVINNIRKLVKSVLAIQAVPWEVHYVIEVALHATPSALAQTALVQPLVSQT